MYDIFHLHYLSTFYKDVKGLFSYLLLVINVKMFQHNAELGMPQRKLKGERTWPSMQSGGHRHVPVAGGVCSSLSPCKPYCTWRSSSWACEHSGNKQGTQPLNLVPSTINIKAFNVSPLTSCLHETAFKKWKPYS